MTDVEKLSKYLTPEEIAEMREEGKLSESKMDVEATYKVMQKYLDAGMEEEATNMMSVVNDRINYYHDLVETVTGKSIIFSEASGRWHDSTSGVFVRDPYVSMYQSQGEIENQIAEIYS